MINIWGTDRRSEYDTYLDNHTENVRKAFNWFELNMPSLMDEITFNNSIGITTYHDSSKNSIEEYIPYADYFYGEQTKSVKNKFDYAWLHHIHNNPHHWQYWVLQEDEGDVKALEIPHEYVVEMICDWWSFSWSKGDLYEIFDWYENHKDKMILNDKTRKKIEFTLDAMKDRLDVINFG